MLCPTVRLLLGELWLPWEEKEMGIGPEALMTALAEVSEEDIPGLREGLGEMGLVAEAALRQKGQHSLCSEPLQALSVYERLRRISRFERQRIRTDERMHFSGASSWRQLLWRESTSPAPPWKYAGRRRS